MSSQGLLSLRVCDINSSHKDLGCGTRGSVTWQDTENRETVDRSCLQKVSRVSLTFTSRLVAFLWHFINFAAAIKDLGFGPIWTFTTSPFYYSKTNWRTTWWHFSPSVKKNLLVVGQLQVWSADLSEKEFEEKEKKLVATIIGPTFLVGDSGLGNCNW